VYDPIG